MEVFHEIQPLREWVASRRPPRRIAFVPTMGALHEGHDACIAVARDVREADVVVSIFVNPTQFAPGEDLDAYPRTLPDDLARCERLGVAAVFAPRDDVMYPRPQRTWVNVEGLTECLCGAHRPGHFRGVTTVVTKLFEIVRPDVAVFGQKDAQQALVIREMVRQLDMPVELRLARTQRESDGLARSSRNAYLDADARRRAASLHAALREAAARLEAGERDARAVEAAARERLAAGGVDDVEYVEIRRADDLSALERVEGRVILALAARVGAARLIDNMVFDVRPDGVDVDVMLFGPDPGR